jgi:SPP1 gp7 family putative phage head morphogenesis protein
VNDALFSKALGFLSSAVDRAMKKLEDFNINDYAQSVSKGFLSRLNRNNDDSTRKNLKNNMGVDLQTQIVHEDIDDALDMAIKNNVALIKSIKNDYISDIGAVLRKNVLEGGRSTNLITQIKDRGNVHVNQAKFIARDQTAKINADLTEIRSKALGSSTYTWSGSMDERERKTHKSMEGMLCKWSDPTVYSDDNGVTWKKRSAIGAVELHPGKDFQCRCVSIPSTSWS